MSPHSRRTALGAALIAAAALGLYGATLGFDFVFDDHVQIERNPWLRDPDGLRLFFTQPFWGFYHDRGAGPSNYYRPLFGVFYSLLARAFGLQAMAFHAGSVLLHAAVCLLVALGARHLVPKDGADNDAAALGAGLFFAVYPAHAEAVAWVGGQADLLAALFVLLATLAYLSGIRSGFQKPKAKIQNLSGPVCYLLACLSKETGAALILVLFAIEASEWRREGSPGAALRRGAARLAPYALVLAVYLVLRVNALGGFAPRHYGVTASLAGAVAFAGALLARYLGFLLAPLAPQVLVSVPNPGLLSLAALAGLFAATLAVAGLAAAVWNGRARREIVLPLAFIFAFLLPVLASNSIGGAHFAERYLYLPSVGLAWLAGLLWSRVARALPAAGTARRAVTAFALVDLLVLGAVAWERSTIYRDDLALFTEAARGNPGNEIARNNLGRALYHEGRLDEAEREYREALRLRPGSVAPLSNLAILYERRGQTAKAKAAFEETLRRSPTHAAAAVHLARFRLAEGDTAGAARSLDALLAAGGESYDALVERAGLWLREGRPEKAVPLLERAVAAFPDQRKGRKMLERARLIR
jgi:protein O-mannosyl-transferase